MIVQRGISRHRVPFYERLRSQLAERDIELQLVHGYFAPWERGKGDLACIPWATQIDNKVLRCRGREIYWQPVPLSIFSADLVVVEQANRLLLNYLMLLLRPFTGQRVALWGHGRNFQAKHPGSVLERFKKWWSRRADWFFLYTEHGAQLMQNAGANPSRMSVVFNTIDTRELQETKAEISRQQLDDLRLELGINNGAVAIYCGGLYRGKRIRELISAASEIRRALPDFSLIIIGAGEESGYVENKARELSWLHYLGPMHGRERVPYFMLADVQLIPGVVGLSVIDSFALGVPMVTMQQEGHGPEINYIEPGKNGLITADNLQEYVAAVQMILKDRDALFRMKSECEQSVKHYSLDNMVKRFADGVEAAISGNAS